MNYIYRTILSSILSEKEIKKIADIDNACKRDSDLYKLLCSKGCFLFADWAEEANYYDEFCSFVNLRLNAFSKSIINDFDKKNFLNSLNGRKFKGDTMILLLEHFKKEIEFKDYVFLNLDCNDDTYRLCITNVLCAKHLNNIDFMEGKFVAL